MYDKIQAALDLTLQGISGIPTIAWENTRYDPITNTPYLRTRFMPMDRRPASLGIDPFSDRPYNQRYSGIYQILLHYPSDTGVAATNATANLIIDAFDATKELVPVSGVYTRILQTEKMRAYQDSPWYKTPINVHWYSYTT